MLMKTLVIAAVSLCLWGTVGTAKAEPEALCAERDAVLSALAKEYGEAPVAIGVIGSGGLVEVLSSGVNGTWTIILTSPQGLSCLIVSGEGWRPIEPRDATPATVEVPV